jgi:hypothetical protein
MSDALLKVCPKCLTLAELPALRCGNCTHLFRARRPDQAAPRAPRQPCPAEEPRAVSAPYVLVWAAGRTVILLAIAALLGIGAALAGRADYTGLRCSCEIMGFFTCVGTLLSGADAVTVLPLWDRGPEGSRGSKPTAMAGVPSLR